MGLADILKPLPVAGVTPPQGMSVRPGAILDQSQIEDRRSGIPKLIDIGNMLQQSAAPFTPPPITQPSGLANQLAQRTLTAAATLEPTKFPGSKSLDMLQTLAKVLGKGQGQGPGMPGAPGFPTTPGVPYSGPTSFTPLPAGRYPIINKNPNPGYDPAQVTPEIQHAALELWARFPGLSNMGTHVIKNVAGTSTPSEHSYGNAIDIGGTGKTLAEVASWAVAHAAKLGLSQVIYQTSIWTSESGWHPYTGVPHTTHVHLSGPLTYSNTNPNYPTVNFTPPKTPPKTQPRTQPRVSRAETRARRGRQR
jgi:hypothetical protein